MSTATIFESPCCGESPAAWAAFISYRDQGSARSLRRVAREWHKSFSLIGRWSRRWGWRQRAREYDLHLDGLRRAAAGRLVQEMAQRHALVAMQAQERVVQRLNSLTQEDVDRMTFGQLASLLQVAVQIERQARGLAATVLKARPKTEPTTGEDGFGPVGVIETVVRSRAEAREEGVAVLLP